MCSRLIKFTVFLAFVPRSTFPKCKLCESGDVEDEIHFLCDCIIYNDTREIMFSKVHEGNSIFREMDSLDKFVYLMSNHERAVISFLSSAVEKRRQSLYIINGSN